jgi:hypothetical protein
MDQGLARRASTQRGRIGFLKLEILTGRKGCGLMDSGHMGQEPSKRASV